MQQKYDVKSTYFYLVSEKKTAWRGVFGVSTGQLTQMRSKWTNEIQMNN